MKTTIFDFERYTATGIYSFLAFIAVATFFAVLLLEAKKQNSNWSSPKWTANITILVASCFAGALFFRIIEVWTQVSIPEGPWNFVFASLLGWVITFLIHSIVKRIAPETLKVVALKMFS